MWPDELFGEGAQDCQPALLPSVLMRPNLDAQEKIGPRFGYLETRREHKDQSVCELEWLDEARRGRSRAVLWEPAQGLVVPLSYRRHERFDDACARFAEHGWPVRLRRSGGGVVPQGPGILNLSLVYPVGDRPGFGADQVYRHLCDVLSRSLAQLGIATRPAIVTGSFCDGRFNLAVASIHGLRKIAGTAQYWRRVGTEHAVLVHALVLVAADMDLLTRRCNEFESALGSGRRYDANTLTSVAEAWSDAHPGEVFPTDLATELTRRIAATLN